MSKRILFLFLSLVLIGLLTSCTSNSTPTNNSGGTPSNQPTDVSKINPGNVPINGDSSATIAHNVEVGDQYKLPSDIPVISGAVETSKRQSNKLVIFDYRASQNLNEVNKFYNEQMKAQGWEVAPQQSNSTDGLLFKKGSRLTRIISVNNKADKAVDIHFYVNEMVQATNKNPEKDTTKVAANVADVLQIAPGIPKDVPVYANSETKVSRKRGIYYEFKSNDSVDTIANWYLDNMKQNGWAVDWDTSAMGDSMKIYTKNDEKGNRRYVGIRVNDVKEENKRWFMIVNYPNNSVIPHSKDPRMLTGEQPASAEAVKEALERASKQKQSQR